MRQNIVHPGADKLSYEIRGIVEVARKIEKAGVPIIWENIGDPVAKGEKVPEWIQEIVAQAAKENDSYAYSPTKGLLKTREYIANERNKDEWSLTEKSKPGIQITPDDVLFFNGLGDAIRTIYANLDPKARLIGPNPAYPTHSSAEAAHADLPHITYELDPYQGWQPDLEELERKIQDNPGVAGIIIINPDNPTGFVYPQETLKKIVELAKKYKLFILSDEIYSNLFYETEYRKLASVIGDVPGIAMRGISKEFPWPGARCGWVEFYNRDKDKNFDRYCQALIDAKMLEVCSTTMPQKVLPIVMSDPRYYPYLAERNKKYQKRAETAYQILSKIPELVVNKPKGAFYMTAVFKKGILDAKQKLKVGNSDAEKIIGPFIDTKQFDKRFVYYLLASSGICVVPLSTGFNSTHFGFRFTILEEDDKKFEKNLETIAAKIREYLKS